MVEGISHEISSCNRAHVLFVHVFFRDVKASSILLDDKYEVRVGSLSDARIQDSDSHPNILSRMFGLSR